MAEYKMADKANYYMTESCGDYQYTVKDVTAKTELVYETLYKPLEKL
jgi:hypothetical protein